MYNSGNPTRKEAGFKITYYVLVLLIRKQKMSSYNCMKNFKRLNTTCNIDIKQIKYLTLGLCTEHEI